jgi:hypothetical protein
MKPQIKSTWTDSIRAIVKHLPRKFTTKDVYAWEESLSINYSENNNIRAKIRQQLQVLRDCGELKQGRQRGQWMKLRKAK